MRPTVLRTALLLAGLSLPMGAGLPAPAEPGKPKRERTCIRKREVNAISGLDDRHALARLSAGRFYLLTLDEACRGLALARRLTFDRGETRVCSEGTSLLAFEEPALGAVRCRVERIEPVADRNAARDLIAERAGPR